MIKIIFFIIFSTGIFSIDFNFIDYFLIDNSFKESPSGETVEIRLNNLIEYTSDRYLAILTKVKTMPFNKPKTLSDIEKQKKEGKTIIDVDEELKIERYLYLAFIKKNGKILQESESIEIKNSAGNSKPFFLEDENLCPYGFINNADNKIYCFDYSLKLKSKIEIPLDEVYDYSIEFDGKNHSFWIFGKRENFNKIGKIYEIKNKNWKDIPITIDDIYSEILGKVKNPENEKPKISKKSIKIYNVKDGKIFLSIDEKDSTKENYFNSRRHFFKLSISSDTNTQVEQINLWFEFSDISEIKWDEEKSVLFFPSLFKEVCYSFNPLSENSFLFLFTCGVSFPDDQGKYNEEAFSAYFFTFSFNSPSSKPEYFDEFTKLRDKIYDETKGKEKLWILPFFHWHLKKNIFLFLSPWKEKDSCYVLVEIS